MTLTLWLQVAAMVISTASIVASASALWIVRRREGQKVRLVQRLERRPSPLVQRLARRMTREVWR